MTGLRKFHFALYGLGALSGGFLAAVWRSVPAPLFEAFAWGVVGIVAAFGVPNAGEHLAEALRARKEPKA